MATIHFKGKSAVWNHHLSVPYHALEKDPKESLKGNNESENLIIEGDNLLALKALLPKYQGKVKCIYIDPPYNTGNEGWVYSDNVSSPLIKDWIDNAVGKDDLTRHDKWLCMMTPRLKLLRELLSDEGIILISIDENELSNLIMVCNEIFGVEKPFTIFVWKKRSGANDAKDFVSTDHEYIVAYRKSETFIFNGIKKNFSNYTNPDNDPRGAWAFDNLTCNKTKEERPNLFYPITDPKTGRVYEANPNRVWVYEPERMGKLIKEGKVIFPKNGTGTPQYKRHLNEVRSDTKPISTWIEASTVSTNQILEEQEETDVAIMQSDLNSQATKMLRELLGGQYFDNPKPVYLIQQLIEQSTNENDIILDSFSGSGTTAQAVIEQNMRDNKNRKFILIQLPEAIEKNKPAYTAGFRWIHEITRGRVKKVIEKQKSKIGFTYFTLGSAIDAETLLSGNLPKYQEFAKYVYYLATGKNHPDEKKIRDKDFFVAKTDHQSIYLVYQQDMEALKKLAITFDWAQKINNKDAGKKIVYAPACFLDEETLDELNMKFVNIPYNLFERTL